MDQLLPKSYQVLGCMPQIKNVSCFAMFCRCFALFSNSWSYGTPLECLQSFTLFYTHNARSWASHNAFTMLQVEWLRQKSSAFSMLKSRMMRKYDQSDAMMRSNVRQVVGRLFSPQQGDASGTPASLRMHGLFRMCLGRSQVAAGGRSCQNLSKLSKCGSVSLTKLTHLWFFCFCACIHTGRSTWCISLPQHIEVARCATHEQLKTI